MLGFLAPPPDIRQPVIILDDSGGLVETYRQAAIRYNREKRRVEIRGSCRSACTLALGVKNVCVGKGAIIKWHHAYSAYDGTPRYEVTRQMLSEIPFRVAQTVSPFISINYSPNATLAYAQLLQLGIPDCDGGQTTLQASLTTLPQQPRQGEASREQVLGAIGYKSGAEQYAAKTSTSALANTARDEVDPLEQKKLEFDAAYSNALSISTKQHGSPVAVRNCDRVRCEVIAAYYNRKGQYIELHKSLSSDNRVICRLSREGIFEDDYSCTNWLTGQKLAYHWSREPLY